MIDIASLTNEQRQTVIERLSEQSLAVLQAALGLLEKRVEDFRYNSNLEGHLDLDRIRFLEDAIIYKAFENILDPDCMKEGEKFNNLVRMRSGSEE